MTDDTNKREVVSVYELAVDELVHDMMTRQGFKQLWGAGMEDDVKEEVKEEWRRILCKIIGSAVPGLMARHCIITDNCRRVQGGDQGAIDEALKRIREMMEQSIPNWPLDHDHRFHLCFTVERGAKAELARREKEMTDDDREFHTWLNECHGLEIPNTARIAELRAQWEAEREEVEDGSQNDG